MPAFRSAGTAVEAALTIHTVAYTLTSGDRLFALVSAHNSGAPTTVVWNTTESMTLVGAWSLNSGNRSIGLYELVGGTAGTANIVATFAGSTTAACVGFGYSGTTSAHASSAQSQGATGSTALTLTMGATNISGTYSSNSFGWAAAGAIFDGLAIMVSVAAANTVTLSMINGTERHTVGTGNFRLHILDRAAGAGPLIGGKLVGRGILRGRLVA